MSDEIGAFLSLGKTWQHLDGIRLLMGNETTRRTKERLINALQDAKPMSSLRD